MKYIIFDFDGTIGDSQRLIVKTLQDTMRERGLEVKSDEACAKTIGLRLDEAFVALFGMSAEEGEACAATYREIFMKNKEIMIVEPFPHVIETLRNFIDVASYWAWQAAAAIVRSTAMSGRWRSTTSSPL